MSLILESLQRAEEERKGGPVSEPEAPYEAPEPERKSWRRVLWVIVGLGVGAAASIAVLQGFRGKENRVASTTQSPQRPSGEGRELAPPTVSFPTSGDIRPDDARKGSQDRPSTQPSTRPGSSMVRTPEGGSEPSASIPPSVAALRPPEPATDPSDSLKSAETIGKSASESTPRTVEPLVPEAGRAVENRLVNAAPRREIPPRTSSSPSEAKDPQGALKPAAGVPDDASPASSEAGVSVTTPAVSQKTVKKKSRSGRIPLFRELPLETQTRFKDLNLNVVVHEKNPAESLVFINLGQYREGDRIGGSGLQVERILPDGVVLDYGQGRFKLKMYQ